LLHYDYIITGMGCAGLSLACHLIEHDLIQDKKILLLDRAPKIENDRTWCSWQNEAGLFETIVKHQWKKVNFHGDNFDKELDIAPYTYKMIRGIDFYNYAYECIAKHPNIHIVYTDVQKVQSETTGAIVYTATETYTTDFVFNSIQFKNYDTKGKYNFIQHFKGWEIQTKQPVFNPNVATLMDFRVPQLEDDITFVYVLPTTPQKAFIEYTIFSKQLLTPQQYDQALKDYIHTYIGVKDYTITHIEFGTIPMTDAKFPDYGKHIINIGIAGAAIKPSTGYGFSMIQRQCQAIVEQLKQNNTPYYKNHAAKPRYTLYDNTLFNVLNKRKPTGKAIFTDMFKHNPAERVLRFLDNNTTIIEEIKIMNTVPTRFFLPAAIVEFFKKMLG
jgi:lycopene beta-cyclase